MLKEKGIRCNLQKEWAAVKEKLRQLQKDKQKTQTKDKNGTVNI